jgi:hypothetical protein
MFVKIMYNIVLIVSLTLNLEIFYLMHLMWQTGHQEPS